MKCRFIGIFVAAIVGNAQEHPSTEHAFFAETFEQVDGGSWVKSIDEKYTSEAISIQKSSIATGYVDENHELVFEKPARHYGIAVNLKEPFALDGNDKKEMVIQYEVRLSEGLDCGGAYIKLLDHQVSNDLTLLTDQTPYIIMFGPDKCGSDSKVHFIVRHENPVTKTWQEKHLENRPTPPTDQKTHLYTLIIHESDNTYEILIDQKSVAKGSLDQDFSPAFTTPETIPDENDIKPEDWIDEAMMDDPTATKPDDWDEDAPAHVVDQDAVKPTGWLDDEPYMISDPEAVKPEDWDEEDDGEWEAPQITNPKCSAVGCGTWTRPMKPNPAYKGKWVAPKVENPQYKGEWAPRNIANPEYYVENHPARMHPIGAIALEIWTMSGGITFDNFWLGYDSAAAATYAEQTWVKRHALEMTDEEKTEAEAKSKVRQMMLDEGGWQNVLYVYALDVQEFLLSLPRLGLISGIAALLFFFSFMCSRKRTSGVGKEKDDKEETSPKPAASDEKDSKLRQRKKKAPKAE